MEDINGLKIIKSTDEKKFPSPCDPSWDRRTWPDRFIDHFLDVVCELHDLVDVLNSYVVMAGVPDTDADRQIAAALGHWDECVQGLVMYRRIMAGVDDAREVELDGERLYLVGDKDGIDLAAALLGGIDSIGKEGMRDLIAPVVKKMIDDQVNEDSPSTGLYM